jgi:NTP pyrophosphatase (non-canonical NTP hydrolase)
VTDQYQPNGIALSAHELEVLTILAEEAAEVIQAVIKVIRFGKDDTNGGKHLVTSNQTLGLEIGDLSHMVMMAMRLGLIHATDMNQGMARKSERLKRYMQTVPP